MKSKTNVKTSSDIKIVNVVSSGKIKKEFELTELYEKLDGDIEYARNNKSGIYKRYNEHILATFYESGKYILMLSKNFSTDELYDKIQKIHENITEDLIDSGVIESKNMIDYNIVNIVGKASVKDNLDLRTLAIGLGLDKVEYEPEQFPGLTYRNETYNSTFLVFSNGNIILAGGSDISDYQDDVSNFKEKIDDIFRFK